ncbi:hypothetical protein ACP70R_003909 [Stipagrostis hirtigluma subsp. patula]
METLTQLNGPSGSPAPSSAAGQRWVMLDRFSNRRAESSATVDGNTMVACRTSTGWPINVSFNFTAAPASSLVYFDWVGVAPVEDDRFHRPQVIAAHGDYILLEMMVPHSSSVKRSAIDSSDITIDHFLYETGAAAGRPPSMSMLPCCKIPKLFEHCGGPSRLYRRRRMGMNDTGLLRLSDDELLIAQLKVARDEPYDIADLYVLRVGHEWELKQAVPVVVVRDDEGSKGDEASSRWWDMDAVFSIGDRFLCWVNYNSGFFLCDMAADQEASPKLWRVSLPAEAVLDTDDDDQTCMQQSRSMGAAGPSAVRFVSIDPRCCCGAPGTSTCAQGRFAFRVTTWTLAVSTDQTVAMTWVKDNVLDCYELWALPSYKGLPRVYPEYPTVSLDNPDIICFVIKDDNFVRYEDWKVWVVEVDMRSKSMLSASRCSTDRSMGSCPLSAKLQW